MVRALPIHVVEHRSHDAAQNACLGLPATLGRHVFLQLMRKPRDGQRLQPDASRPGQLSEEDLVRLRIKATARITAKTGVEMEALTAVAVAALTLYDMCKAIDKNIIISDIRLISKTGGKSGTWRAPRTVI